MNGCINDLVVTWGGSISEMSATCGFILYVQVRQGGIKDVLTILTSLGGRAPQRWEPRGVLYGSCTSGRGALWM